MFYNNSTGRGQTNNQWITIPDIKMCYRCMKQNCKDRKTKYKQNLMLLKIAYFLEKCKYKTDKENHRIVGPLYANKKTSLS